MTLLRPFVLRRKGLGFPGTRPGFDPSHPAANGIIKTAGFSGISLTSANFINLLSGARGTPAGAPTAIRDGTLGPCLVATAATSVVNFAGQQAVANSAVTIGGLFRVTQAAGFEVVFSIAGSGVALQLNSEVPELVLTNQITSALPAIIIGVPYFLAASVCSTSSAFVLRRLDTGQLFTDTKGGDTTSAAGNGTYQVGNFSVNSVPLDGRIAAAMFSPNFTSLQDLVKWSADPWSFWYPSPVPFGLEVLSSGPTTAAAAPVGFHSQSRVPYPAKKPFIHLAPSVFAPPIQPNPTLTWQSRISAEIPKQSTAYVYSAPNPAFVPIPPQVLGWGSVFADTVPPNPPRRESPFIAFGQPPILTHGWRPTFPDSARTYTSPTNSPFLAWDPQTITLAIITGWNPSFPDFAKGRTPNTDSPFAALGQPPAQVLGWNPNFPDSVRGHRPRTDSPFTAFGLPPFQVLGWNPAFPDFARKSAPPTDSPFLAWAPQTIVQAVITEWFPSFPDFAKGRAPNTDSPFSAFGRPPTQVLGWNPSFPDFAKGRLPNTDSPVTAFGRPPTQILGWNPTFPDSARTYTPPTHSPFLAWTSQTIIKAVITGWTPVFPDFAKGYQPRTDSPFTALGRPPAQVLGWNPTYPDFAKAKQPPTHSPFLAWTTLGTIPISYWHPVLSIPVRTKEGLKAGAHQFLAWSSFTPSITVTISLTTSDLFDSFLAQLDTASPVRVFASVGIVEKTQHSGSVGVLANRPIVSSGTAAGTAATAKVAIREKR